MTREKKALYHALQVLRDRRRELQFQLRSSPDEATEGQKQYLDKLADSIEVLSGMVKR